MRISGAVMEGCAAPRPGREKTWISPAVHLRVHAAARAGVRASVEVWHGERLVGGLYGVAVGGLFAGESMFSEEENGSKVALVAMEEKLRTGGFVLFDVQMMTPHLKSMGAVEIPRAEYLRAAQGGAGPLQRGPFTPDRMARLRADHREHHLVVLDVGNAPTPPPASLPKRISSTKKSLSFVDTRRAISRAPKSCE